MIVFSDAALADLERIFEFRAQRDAMDALERVNAIRSAVMILEEHPEIGRRIGSRSNLRELTISRGVRGYVALYEYFPLDHCIVILAIRHQREAGYLQ